MKAAAWKKMPDGRWVANLGTRGSSIRVHQLQPGGTFYRDIGGGSSKSRRSLGTTDRNTALSRAKHLLAELIRQDAEGSRADIGTVSLRRLWEMYQAFNADWLDNAPSSQRDDRRKAKMLLGFFGDDYDVMRLSENEQRRYENARRQGFSLPDGTVVGPVRQATIWADIVLLQSMLRWGASKYRLASGKHLLSGNPLSGVKNRKEETPLRPVATEERYRRLLAATEELEKDQAQRRPQKWALLRLLIQTANATGRRVSAIRHLGASPPRLNPP
jgi:hypothetical protein